MRNAITDIIKEELHKNGEFKWNGIGTFKVAHKPERECRNIRTGEKITVPAKDVVKFKPTKSILEE